MFTTVHRIFPLLMSWGSAGRLCWLLSRLELECYQLLQTPLLLQFFQIGPPLGLGATILVSFSDRSPLCSWVRLPHDHRRGDEWVPWVWGWNHWCMPGTAPWSYFRLVIIEVSDSGFLTYLTFGAIGPLEQHDVQCNLELQLKLHWLVLQLLVGYGPIVDYNSQLWLGMWLVALPDRGDNAVLRPILTRWLTRLLEFRDGFCGWFCSRRPPHILLFSWMGIFCEYMQVWNSFLLFRSTKFIDLGFFGNIFTMLGVVIVFLNL